MANFIDFSVYSFHAGSVNTVSGIFVGENLQYGWRLSSKSNIASAKICGDNNISSGSKDEILDPDMLDTFVQKENPFTELTPPSPALARTLAKAKKRYRKVDVNPLEW